MSVCEQIRELLPWFVEGSLAAEESAATAEHLASCPECLRDLAAAIRVRAAVRDAMASEPRAMEAAWERVARLAMGRRLAQVDVGSFLLGFRLGAWATRRWSPVRADLRVLGRNVHLVERGKGGRSA